MTKTKIICFIGPDGSGKSTLAKHLLNEAMKRHKEVLYLWWLESENSLIRRIIRKLGSPIKKTETKTEAESNKKMSKIVRIVYPRIVLIDYIWFGFKNLTLPKMSGRWGVIILDRFIYDPIIFMSEEFEYDTNKRERLLRICSNILPKPDMVFIIDVPAYVSYMRKKNEIRSVESAEKMLLAYNNIYPIIDKLAKRVVKIDNTCSLEDVKKKILEESGILN